MRQQGGHHWCSWIAVTYRQNTFSRTRAMTATVLSNKLSDAGVSPSSNCGQTGKTSGVRLPCVSRETFGEDLFQQDQALLSHLLAFQKAYQGFPCHYPHCFLHDLVKMNRKYNLMHARLLDDNYLDKHWENPPMTYHYLLMLTMDDLCGESIKLLQLCPKVSVLPLEIKL